MANLIGDFTKYLSFVDNFPLFNEESYLQSKPKYNFSFYKEFIETQGFNYFLQFNDIENDFPYYYKKSCTLNCKYYSTAIQEEKTKREENYNDLNSKNKTKNKLFKQNTYIKTSNNLNFDISNVKDKRNSELTKDMNDKIINDLNSIDNTVHTIKTSDKNSDSFNNSFSLEQEKLELNYKKNYIVVPPFLNNISYKDFTTNSYYNKIETFNAKECVKSIINFRVILEENTVQQINLEYLFSFINTNQGKIASYDYNVCDFSFHHRNTDRKISALNTYDANYKKTKNDNFIKKHSSHLSYIIEKGRDSTSTVLGSYNSNMDKANSILINPFLNKRTSKFKDEIYNNHISKEFRKNMTFQDKLNLNSNIPRTHKNENKQSENTKNLNEKIFNDISDFEEQQLKENKAILENYTQNTNKSSISLNDSKKETRKYTLITRNIGKTIDEIAPTQLKEIEEFITDCFKDILTSKTLSSKQKQNLKVFFKIKDSITLFSQIVFLKKFMLKQTQCLSAASFNDLLELIFLVLLYCGEETINIDSTYIFHSVMLITESCFFYYVESKLKYKIKFLYHDLIKKSGCFKIWLDSNFWEYWLLYLFNESENVFNNEEDFKYNHFVYILNKMMMLNIPSGNLDLILIKELGGKYLEDEDREKLRTIFKKQQKLLILESLNKEKYKGKEKELNDSF